MPSDSSDCGQWGCGSGLFSGPPACSGSDCTGGSAPPCSGDSCGGPGLALPVTEPGDEGDESTPPPAVPDSTDDPNVPYEGITGMKITVTVRSGVQGQQPTVGESLKIPGMDFGLPPACSAGCDESSKTDVASGSGPLQCVTGADGRCEIDIPACEYDGSAECTDGANGLGDNFQVFPLTLGSTPTASSIGALKDGMDPAAGCQLGGALCDAVTDRFSIGGQGYFVFAYPADQEAAFLAAIGSDPMILYVEINFCGEKKLPKPVKWKLPTVGSSLREL